MLLEPYLGSLQCLVCASQAALSLAVKLSPATFLGRLPSGQWLPGKEETCKGQPQGLKGAKAEVLFVL